MNKKRFLISIFLLLLISFQVKSQDNLFDLEQTVDEFIQRYADKNKREHRDLFADADEKRLFYFYVEVFDAELAEAVQTDPKKAEELAENMIEKHEILQVLQQMGCTLKYMLNNIEYEPDTEILGTCKPKPIFKKKNWQAKTTIGEFVNYFIRKDGVKDIEKWLAKFLEVTSWDLDWKNKKLHSQMKLDYTKMANEAEKKDFLDGIRDVNREVERRKSEMLEIEKIMKYKAMSDDELLKEFAGDVEITAGYKKMLDSFSMEEWEKEYDSLSKPKETMNIEADRFIQSMLVKNNVTWNVIVLDKATGKKVDEVVIGLK